MTGKEKLIKWIERASIGETRDIMFKSPCPREIGLINSPELNCDGCWKWALEMEYPDD
jgi:hypothetical protein